MQEWNISNRDILYLHLREHFSGMRPYEDKGACQGSAIGSYKSSLIFIDSTRSLVRDFPARAHAILGCECGPANTDAREGGGEGVTAPFSLIISYKDKFLASLANVFECIAI